jgi:dTMP kinase
LARNKARGVFICLEGSDGSGKGTQAQLLADWLRSAGMDMVLTKEPTGGPIGVLLREIIRGNTEVPPLAEAMLFAADRSYHLEREILPALRAGKIVVCDRYIHSSLAYQPARGVPEQAVRELNRHFPKPDLAILLDVSTEVAAKRAEGKTLDAFERDRQLQGRVRENYLRIFREEGSPILDGRLNPRILAGEIRKLVAPLVGLGKSACQM